jgi:chaperonin GroES
MLLLSALCSLKLPAEKLTAQVRKHDPDSGNEGLCQREYLTDFHTKERYMKFRPLHDRIVIKRIEAEAKSAGGIIIPDTAKEKPQQGEVVAVGPGGRDETGKLIPIDIKIGDRVLFGKWSGTEVKIDDDEYLIMKESDVMGILVETEARRKAA